MLSWSADIPAKEMAPRTGLGADNRYRKAGQEAIPGPKANPASQSFCRSRDRGATMIRHASPAQDRGQCYCSAACRQQPKMMIFLFPLFRRKFRKLRIQMIDDKFEGQTQVGVKSALFNAVDGLARHTHLGGQLCL
jgi:hypothetical protein